jgi:hypothetical protein
MNTTEPRGMRGSEVRDRISYRIHHSAVVEAGDPDNRGCCRGHLPHRRTLAR